VTGRSKSKLVSMTKFAPLETVIGELISTIVAVAAEFHVPPRVATLAWSNKSVPDVCTTLPLIVSEEIVSKNVTSVSISSVPW